jgi:hypothetical protein
MIGGSHLNPNYTPYKLHNSNMTPGFFHQQKNGEQFADVSADLVPSSINIFA